MAWAVQMGEYFESMNIMGQTKLATIFFGNLDCREEDSSTFF